jgi:hypothetical protein
MGLRRASPETRRSGAQKRNLSPPEINLRELGAGGKFRPRSC